MHLVGFAVGVSMRLAILQSILISNTFSSLILFNLYLIIFTISMPSDCELKRAWGEVFHIMAYTGRLPLKGVPFSGFRYIEG